MLDIESIRSAIVRNLKATTGIQTIIAEQSSNQPDYPFIAVKMTLLGQKVGGSAQYMDGLEQVTEQDIEMVMSVSSYSDDMDESINNSYKALQFFEVDGVELLQDHNIAVVQTTDITNRDTFISIEYERRTGFDVRIRTRAQVTKEIEVIETVELKEG